MGSFIPKSSRKGKNSGPSLFPSRTYGSSTIHFNQNEKYSIINWNISGMIEQKSTSAVMGDIVSLQWVINPESFLKWKKWEFWHFSIYLSYVLWKKPTPNALLLLVVIHHSPAKTWSIFHNSFISSHWTGQVLFLCCCLAICQYQ